MKNAIIVTTINNATEGLVNLRDFRHLIQGDLIIIGDARSPEEFQLDGSLYFDLKAQRSTGLRFAEICPIGHYSRKNIGYLLAAKAGYDMIVETDDDNIPLDGFWKERTRRKKSALVSREGWVNTYKYFTDAEIWPRGLPLSEVRQIVPTRQSLGASFLDCPIQQGLANGDPDVDAIYRFINGFGFEFAASEDIVLDKGAWCPFNSQNTTFWRDAFALMYLPSYCSFRMTDIWRSFVAQRLAWELDWRILFHSPTVLQIRNKHDLLSDFAEEVPGYLNNKKIVSMLEGLHLSPGFENITDNMMRCYDGLIKLGLIDKRELSLLSVWLQEIY